MYSVLRSLGLEPGGEFKAGIEEAEKIGRILCLLPCINDENNELLIVAFMHIQGFPVYKYFQRVKTFQGIHAS